MKLFVIKVITKYGSVQQQFKTREDALKFLQDMKQSIDVISYEFI